MRTGIGDSALKRADLISYSDILHVANTGDYLSETETSTAWWFGTTPTGLDIELTGVLATEGDAMIIIHAFPMKWRKK